MTEPTAPQKLRMGLKMRPILPGGKTGQSRGRFSDTSLLLFNGLTRMSKKEPKITISGYYGFNNCGDEAVLMAVVHCLKKLEPGVEITVLSNAPAATRSLHGVKAAYRWNPFSMLYRIIQNQTEL